MARPSRRRAVARLAALLTVGALATPVGSPAAADGDEPRLVVMSRNLYLGSSLVPALQARTASEFLGAVARIYATMQFTDFPARANALAAEIAEERPDVVGLQEVSRWVTSGPGVPPTVDFLTTLGAALSARDLQYEVAAVAANANIGPVPLAQPCASTVVGACTVTLQDRDVLLVRSDRADLSWSDPASGTYASQQSFQPPLPGAPAVSFRRGWTTVDLLVDGTPVHVANTHLETEDFPTVQEAQAAEFLAGPALGPGADVAVGDFNSAADGSTTTTYASLTKRFKDAWLVKANRGDPGLTCCQNETLTNPVSQLGSRIDLVLSRQGAKSLAADVVGDVPFQAVPPLWASDHAGVVATLRLGD